MAEDAAPARTCMSAEHCAIEAVVPTFAQPLPTAAGLVIAANEINRNLAPSVELGIYQVLSAGVCHMM